MFEVADDVWHLPLVPRDGINAYLVGDVLVDTGIKQSAGKIARMLAGRTMSAIALTHAHPDHAGGMKRLVEQFGVPVWCGAADRTATETGRPRSLADDRSGSISATSSRLPLRGLTARRSRERSSEGDSLTPGSPSSTPPDTPRATCRSGARQIGP